MACAWRNLQSLTRWLQRLIYLGIFIDLLTLASEGYRRSVFRRLMAQGVEAAKVVQTANHTGVWANDYVSIPLTGLGLATTILAAVWIYRAATNVRMLGAQGLTVSPGWAVGWYFVPIANFWKPYQAMKEICQASAQPLQWRGSVVPKLLPAWWALWLLSVLIPVSIGMAAGLHADAARSWLYNAVARTTGSLLDIPLSLVFAHMIGRIWQLQSSHPIPSSAPVAGTMSPDAAG